MVRDINTIVVKMHTDIICTDNDRDNITKYDKHVLHSNECFGIDYTVISPCKPQSTTCIKITSNYPRILGLIEK